MPDGVTGNTVDSESTISGSNPDRAAQGGLLWHANYQALQQ